MLFAPIRLLIRLVSLVVLAAAVYLVVSGYQVYSSQGATKSSAASPHGAAIVVYVPPGPHGALDPGAIARLRSARELYLEHVAARAVVAGPSSGGLLSSSLGWMSSHGLAAADVSSQPARNLAAALAALGPGLGKDSTVVIVTDALNAFVARGAAAAAGLTPEIVPVAGSARGVFSEVGSLFGQASAVAVGRVVGLARVPWSGG